MEGVLVAGSAALFAAAAEEPARAPLAAPLPLFISGGVLYGMHKSN